MAKSLDAGTNSVPLSRKLVELNWGLVLLICAVAAIGWMMLYSAAGGSYSPWASRQMIRFAIGAVVMLSVAMVDIRFWLRYAYAIYALGLGLLVSVEVFGVIGMGAQRWVDLGLFKLQPSEVMKVALVLSLARYFHYLSTDEVGRLRWLIAPTLLIAAPVVLVLRQPDLGTAILLSAVGFGIFFMAGVRLWKFAVAAAVALGALPVIWSYLRDYQRARILTFVDPERDPLGAGYHIMQSKIALGSGGLFGKGFMQGTQSHLDFLPEMRTDFIFTMLAEEFGMVGGLVLLSLYILLLAYSFAIALRARNQFGRLVAIGVTGGFFLYVFINIAMVMGLVPVVGVPLPLISYGGTSMMTLLIGFGLLMGVWIHRDAEIPRRPGFSPF